MRLARRKLTGDGVEFAVNESESAIARAVATRNRLSQFDGER